MARTTKSFNRLPHVVLILLGLVVSASAAQAQSRPTSAGPKGEFGSVSVCWFRGADIPVCQMFQQFERN